MDDIKEISEFVAIVSACWAIVTGIGAWKREFIGKRKIELAEDTMAAFFAVRDAIAQIRNPFSYTGEGSTRKRSPNETEEEAQLLDQGFVVIERYQKHEATFIEFSKLKYRFMAVYGAENKKIFEQVASQLNSIFVSARMLSTHYWRRQGRVHMEADEFQKHLEAMHRHERIFWDHQDEEDEIRKNLKSVEDELTKIVTPVIQEYSRAMSSWWKRITSRFF